MKLNFWQWLAIVLLLVGIAWWHYDSRHRGDTESAPSGTAATTPTTVP